MCIFHVLMVRGLSGSKGASMPCVGLPGKVKAPLAVRACCLLQLKYIAIILHVE